MAAKKSTPKLLFFGNAELDIKKKKNYETCKKKGNCPLGKEECNAGSKQDCEKYASIQPYIQDMSILGHFEIDMKAAEVIAHAVNNDHNILLTGPPGIGKTTLPKFMCWLTNREWLEYSCSEVTHIEALIGQWVISGDTMMWSDGKVTDALRNGRVLIENENDFMRPELRSELYGVMDQGGVVTLQGFHPKTGKPFVEVIQRHPDFRWISTANTTGLGENANIFRGRQVQDAAARDRFPIIVRMDYFPKEIEATILEKRTGIDRKTALDMSEVAWAARRTERNPSNNFEFQFGLRRLLAWATYHQILPARDAIQVAILNFASQDPEEINTLCKLIHSRESFATEEVLSLEV